MIIEQTTFIPQTNKVLSISNIDSDTLKKEGQTIHFDKDGKTIAKLNYHNDVLDGMSFVYHNNKVEHQYHEKGKAAHTRIYNYDPVTETKLNIVDELFYENGVLTKVLKYDENGVIVLVTDYSDKGCVVVDKVENSKTFYDSTNEYIQKFNENNEPIIRIIQTRKQNAIDTLFYESMETKTIVSDHYQINRFVQGDSNTVTINNNVLIIEDFDNYQIKSFTIADKPNRFISGDIVDDKVVISSMILTASEGVYTVDFKNDTAHQVTINILEKQIKYVNGELNFFSKIALWLKGVPINAINREITKNIIQMDRNNIKDLLTSSIKSFKVRLGIIDNLFQ